MDPVRLILPALGFVLVAAYAKPWKQGVFATCTFAIVAFGLMSAIATDLLAVRTAVTLTAGVLSLGSLLFSGGPTTTNAHTREPDRTHQLKQVLTTCGGYRVRGVL